EEGVLRAAELLAGRLLELLQVALHLFAQAVGEGGGFDIRDAELGGDGEARGDGQAEVGHLGESRAFAAQDVPHGGRAVGPAVAEEVHPPLEGRHRGGGLRWKRALKGGGVPGPGRLTRDGWGVVPREAAERDLAGCGARREER